MADTAAKGGEQARLYPPEQERLFLGPYPAHQVPQELPAAVHGAVERF